MDEGGDLYIYRWNTLFALPKQNIPHTLLLQAFQNTASSILMHFFQGIPPFTIHLTCISTASTSNILAFTPPPPSNFTRKHLQAKHFFLLLHSLVIAYAPKILQWPLEKYTQLANAIHRTILSPVFRSHFCPASFFFTFLFSLPHLVSLSVSLSVDHLAPNRVRIYLPLSGFEQLVNCINCGRDGNLSGYGIFKGIMNHSMHCDCTVIVTQRCYKGVTRQTICSLFIFHKFINT